MHSRQQIAEQLLSETLGQTVMLEDGQYAPCPGRDKHSKGNGRRDFRVVCDGAPTGYCFHSRCADDVAAFNKELRRRVWFDENGSNPAPRGHWGEGVAAEPKQQAKARPEIDQYAVWEFTRGVPDIDREWCRRHSPVDIACMEPGVFLNHLYRPGERVLVFTDQRSQGDFLWCAPIENSKLSGGFRLSQQRGVSAVPSALPTGAKDGVWFLVQPVTGQWEVKTDVKFHETEGADGKGKWTREVNGMYSRRSQGNVTAWRYFVLEADELPEADWLKVLVNLPLPIAAIYSSGGRSIHALVRLDVESKAAWDAARNVLRQIVCRFGADPAALTAVRLSRLPGCRRGERMQELLFLNPSPVHREIRLMPEVRA